MMRELKPFIWVALVVCATALAIVYNRMINRLRPIHPFVRSIYVWSPGSSLFNPNYRLYRLTFGEDSRAMRLWYWAIALNGLTFLLLVLAGITTILISN